MSAYAFRIDYWQYCIVREVAVTKTKTKLHGLSPHANYTDRAAAAGRRS